MSHKTALLSKRNQSDLRRKIVKIESVFATPWFDVMAQWVGDDTNPFYALSVSDYVSIVAVTPDQNYILVRQFRAAVSGLTVEFPSGTVDKGVTPRQTAIRELFEETGYKAGSMRLAGVLRPDTGRLMNRLWVFYAESCRIVAGAKSESGIEPFVVSSKRLDNMIRAGKFNHALNLAAFALVKNKFK